MKRILLLGSRGRLGAALARCWSKEHLVEGLNRQQLDVADLDQLKTTLRQARYDVLVNATGLTSLEACEEDPTLAHRVNAEAVGVMAEAAHEQEARLIHFSTDYVFNGLSSAPYTEEMTADPLSHYGRSKRSGEIAALESSADHLVFRVSWVFGPDKASFVDMILKKAVTETELEAIADKTSNPTFTEDAAEWLTPFLDRSVDGGLFHACNAGACSWHELGSEALKISQELGWNLRGQKIRPLKLAEMRSFKAVRPVQTAMDTSKLASVIGKAPRPWQEALSSYLSGLPHPIAT